MLTGRAARVEASISTRAASLCALRVDNVDLVDPALPGREPPPAAGSLLFPWPNRVEDASWSLGSTAQRLEVTEPGTGHAVHGLLMDREYDVHTVTEDALVLHTVLERVAGYPFQLDVCVRFTLDEDGLTVTYRIRNDSDGAAPVAIGAHPYLRVGPAPVTGSTLTVQADRALLLDATHIPRGDFDVTGTAWDLRKGRDVSAMERNACYAVAHDEADTSVHRLLPPAGGPHSPTHMTELWCDASFQWVQVYVAEGFGIDGVALAVEPMTAPPNALRTGEGLRWLAPGERWRPQWGIRLR